MQFIDLSLEIGPNNSEPVPVEIQYVDHQQGAELLGEAYGLSNRDFPDGLGLSLEYIKLTSHTGTHIDAPIHYGPFTDGLPARTISELPLEWFYGQGVIIDCTDMSKGILIHREEIKTKLDEMSYKIKPYDIVLIKTGGDKLWGEKSYFTDFRGMTKEATQFLVEQGVKVIGIDTFGFDAPFRFMLEQYSIHKDKSHLWPAHIYGREREYCQIERLANLDKVPIDYGFRIACFPVKIKNCGAGWARVVAIIEN